MKIIEGHVTSLLVSKILTTFIILVQLITNFLLLLVACIDIVDDKDYEFGKIF